MKDNRNLRGSWDLHVHVGPEPIPRKYTPTELAALYAEAEMGCIIKSHFYSTVPMAQMASAALGKTAVFGSLTLNHGVGGLNPFAVRGSLGVCDGEGVPLLKMVWMPTLHAKAHLAAQRAAGETCDIPPEWTGGVPSPGRCTMDTIPPIDLLVPEAQAPLREILRLIAENDLILATGHISREEVLFLVPLARELGVKKIIVTHPIYKTTRLSADDIASLAALDGVYVEASYALAPIDDLPFSVIADSIRAAGPENVVMTTDLGQPNRPDPTKGMALFWEEMAACGFDAAQLHRMTVENPRKLLGLK